LDGKCIFILQGRAGFIFKHHTYTYSTANINDIKLYTNI
jgi:hypothetical protein